MDKKQLEKYSSAFTLSDMEIFIFPELLYSLVMANIMSPVIWKWRDDPWFEGIDQLSTLKKVHRVKQYIMDHYNFNLDLETWGLTDKQTEINRFSDFIDPEILSGSNALFGYEGDKYYFDIDIRRHFGLDQYDSDIIPYWKTETVEAMDAFRHKPGYETGAGECVSLACLYAAALFIVARIPLDRVFLMGTPLHSQNFVMVDEGILTNNRRIVTKAMWFNGTELSSLARRALENEQVTYVSHSSGFVHTIYPEATIDPEAYHAFREQLTTFLATEVDFQIFMNFLRDYSQYQKLFQYFFLCHGSPRYIKLERAFGYEHGSRYRLGEKNSRKLFCEMDEEDMHLQPLDHRFRLDPDNPLFSRKDYLQFLKELKENFPGLKNHGQFFDDLKKFLHVVPRLPSPGKQFNPVHGYTFTCTPSDTREDILDHVDSLRRAGSVTADLAFYAGRFMDRCEWGPFLKAVFERNPVSLNLFRDSSIQQVCEEMNSWPDQSIYDEDRLALPDEVANYKRGDGFEKALTLIHVARSRRLEYKVHQHEQQIEIKTDGRSYSFVTRKNLRLTGALKHA